MNFCLNFICILNFYKQITSYRAHAQLINNVKVDVRHFVFSCIELCFGFISRMDVTDERDSILQLRQLVQFLW